MISKRLTIAAAIVLLSGFGAGQALAQTECRPDRRSRRPRLPTPR